MANGKLSLSTSINNYIDPRITFAFAKKMNVDPSLFLNKKTIEKFHWAKDTPKNYIF